jgi:hypothetical protein
MFLGSYRGFLIIDNEGIQFIEFVRICYNGTAIEGVCVTGEAIRPVVPVVSKERVPVTSRYGAIFAITAN